MSERTKSDDGTSTRAEEFAREATKRSAGIIGEFVSFIRRSGKWWMVPIVVSLLLVAALLVLSTTAAGPLIYTLF